MSRRAPLFAAIGSVVLIILVLVAVVLPRMSAVGKAREELEAARTEQSGLEIQLNTLEGIRRRSPEIERQLAKNQTLIPPQADKPGLVRLVQLVADKTGVDLLSMEPGTPTTSATGDFSIISIQITVDGTFFQIDQFLFQLETLPRAIKVMNIDLTATAWPTLEAVITAESYTTDVSAGPGSTPGHQESGGLTAVPGTTGVSPAPGASPSPSP